MQGVEILNKQPIMIPNEKLAIIAFILICVGAIISGIILYIMEKHYIDNEILHFITIGLFGLSLLSALVVVIMYKEVKIPSDKYRYEAIIDDDVSIQDVYEKYKVIEKDGKKWILEDKEK